MQKRILIIVGSYNIGGTVVSLYSLLTKIKEKNIDVDLFCRYWVGDYKDKMPNCKVLPENIWLSHRITQSGIISKSLCILLWFIRKLFSIIDIDLFKTYCKIGSHQINSRQYDAIIGYDESLAQFISYIPAKKRINWIHCDYRRFANGRDESKYYNKIDTVVCVSEFVKNIFSEIYPQFADKTVAIHNVINVEDINAKAQDAIDDDRFDTTSFTIVSCGRLDPVKQFSLIPSMAKEVQQLTDRDFKWFIIGEGSDRSNIEQEISYNGVSDRVILLGKKPNPYSYMGKADLYVCTSKSESYPLVVNEARALCVPVVCNDFPSASESVASDSDGVISSIDRFPEIIAGFIENPVKNSKCTIDNAHILNQIVQII